MTLGQLIDIATYSNYLITYYNGFLLFILFSRGAPRQSKNSKYHVLKINVSHYISILLNLENALDPISSFCNRAKCELEMFATSCTNIRPNIVLILLDILRKQSKV